MENRMRRATRGARCAVECYPRATGRRAAITLLSPCRNALPRASVAGCRPPWARLCRCR